MEYLEKISKFFTKTKDKTIQNLEESGAMEEIKKHSDNVNEFLDESGISDAVESGTAKVKKIHGAVGENLDQLSGKKILEVVEQRLEVQTEYNDLLASKLEEALERIGELEKIVGKKNEHKKL